MKALAQAYQGDFICQASRRKKPVLLLEKHTHTHGVRHANTRPPLVFRGLQQHEVYGYRLVGLSHGRPASGDRSSKECLLSFPRMQLAAKEADGREQQQDEPVEPPAGGATQVFSSSLSLFTPSQAAAPGFRDFSCTSQKQKQTSGISGVSAHCHLLACCWEHWLQSHGLKKGNLQVVASGIRTFPSFQTRRTRPHSSCPELDPSSPCPVKM